MIEKGVKRHAKCMSRLQVKYDKKGKAIKVTCPKCGVIKDDKQRGDKI